MKSKSVRRALPRHPPATESVRGAATAPSGEHRQRVLAMDEVFPPHDFGPWLRASRRAESNSMATKGGGRRSSRGHGEHPSRTSTEGSVLRAGSEPPVRQAYATVGRAGPRWRGKQRVKEWLWPIQRS